jgi:WD40 repeat protein
MRTIFLLALAASCVAQSAPGDRVIQSDADVLKVAFSPDGSTLAANCGDGKIRLWDAKSGALKRTVPREQGDTSVTLPSPADLLASLGTEGSIRIWDLQTGDVKRRVTGVPRRTRGLVLSADRQLVAGSGRTGETGSEETVRLWDAAGKERFAAPAGLGGTSAMAVSPDGGTLVAASYDTNVRAWNTRNGELLRLIEELPVSMFAMSFSPDGKYLATAGVDRIVYLWDAKTWKLARKLTGQPEMIQSLDFSPDGRRILTGGFSDVTNQNPVTVLLWDVASGKTLRSFPAPHAVRTVAFSPDGMLAAAASQKTVSLWTLPAESAR